MLQASIALELQQCNAGMAAPTTHTTPHPPYVAHIWPGLGRSLIPDTLGPLLQAWSVVLLMSLTPDPPTHAPLLPCEPCAAPTPLYGFPVLDTAIS